MQLQIDILTPLNRLDFHFKALLLSYSVMYSPWRPLYVHVLIVACLLH